MYMRLIVGFKKVDRMKYISHLDLMRTMQRAFNRADIPVAFTEGFNPHPRFSFAAPLSLGISGEHEIMDVMLKETFLPRVFAERMNQYLPKGIRIVWCGFVKDNKPSLMSAITHADYAIKLRERDDSIAKKIAELMSVDCVNIEKKTKKGIKTVNIRPMIEQLSVEDDQEIQCTIATGSKNNLNPKLLMEALFKNGEKRYDNITRKFLYTKENSNRELFLSWVQEDTCWVSK